MLEVFGPEGLIAKAHPEYEYRPGQIEMAQAVMRAFEEKRHLIVEAGTGTGKTLAYLVPAVAAALGGNGRVIISTGTKNLQDQLFERDLPLVRDTLKVPVTIALLKGRANYVCHHHLERTLADGRLPSRDDARHLPKIVSFARTSDTGDRGQLADVPDNAPIWIVGAVRPMPNPASSSAGIRSVANEAPVSIWVSQPAARAISSDPLTNNGRTPNRSTSLAPVKPDMMNPGTEVASQASPVFVGE